MSLKSKAKIRPKNKTREMKMERPKRRPKGHIQGKDMEKKSGQDRFPLESFVEIYWKNKAQTCLFSALAMYEFVFNSCVL